MRTAGPEWGNHKAELFSCRGVFKGVGLPYVYFHRPSYTLMELFPDVAGEAGFQPQGFQLLRCDECSEFEYGLYSPSLNRVAFTTTKPNLPILRDWNWAWETVPS